MSQTENELYTTEVNLMEALKSALVHWRKALVFGLIFAVAIAGYSFRGQLKARATAQEEYDELVEAYNKEVEDYEARIVQLGTDIETAQTKLDELIEYGEKSILLKIAPKKKATASADVLITMDNLDAVVGENGLIYDPTDTLLLLYSNAILSRTDWNRVAEVSGEQSDYAYEIVEVSRNEEANLVTVSVNHYDTRTARLILGELIQQMEEHQEEMASAVGPHTLTVLNERSRLSSDDNLETRQKSYTSSLDSYTKTIDEKTEELENMEEPEKPVYGYTRGKIIKKVGLFGVLGFILGAGLILCWYVFRFSTDGKIHSEQELKGFQLVRVLGSLASPNEDRKTLVESMIRSYGGGVKSVVLVGNVEEADSLLLKSVVQTALPDAVVVVGPNPESSPADYQALISCEAVLLMESIGRSKYAEVLEEKSLARSLNKQIIGCILV